MTNDELILRAMLEHGVDEPVDTYQGWKRLGYQVKKGNKALFSTVIWIPRKKQVKTDDDAENKKRNFFMRKSAFFGKSQVEFIGGNENEEQV